MEFILHKIDGNFFVTTEDFIKEDELFLLGNEVLSNSSSLTEEWCKSKQPKVIANPTQIDFSDLKEEEQKTIGWFDVEKVCESEFKIKNPSDETLWKKAMWKDGFQKAQELLSDRMFTLEDVKKAIAMAKMAKTIDGVINMDAWISDGFQGAESAYSEIEITQSLSQPKSWKVELEMETSPVSESQGFNMKHMSSEFQLNVKFTDGKVKILKLL